MATVSGQGTVFNLPNYTGDLFQVSPQDTPFLSAIGGLSGGGLSSTSVEFEWQTVDLRTSSANNSEVEGAAAPTATAQSRSNVSNVVEIHQSAIEVSYTKQAATGLLNGVNSADGSNPVQSELDFQIRQELASMAVDVEKSFLSGVYAKPATNATPRTTRGILTAITTNVVDNAGVDRALTKALVDSLLSEMYANGSPLAQASTVFVVGPAIKIALSNLYSTSTLNQPTPSRNIGGVNITDIVTDFGTFGVMLDRHMPTDQMAVVDLAVCAPVFLTIPGKGNLFVEPLAKTGASEKFQLYGEVGLKYGPEQYHGILKDLDGTVA